MDRPTDPPPFKRPAKRPGSADSFPAVVDDVAERILLEIQRLEGRVLGRFGNVEQRLDEHQEQIAALRAAQVESRAEAIETRALRQSVQKLLERDVGQDARLAALEARRAAADAEDAGEEAKSVAGSTSRRWSAVGTVIGTIIAAAVASGVQQCSAASDPPAPTYQPRR